MSLRLGVKTTALFTFLCVCSLPAKARTLDYPFSYRLFTSDVLNTDSYIQDKAAPRRMQGGLKEVLDMAQQHVYFSIYGIDKQDWLEQEFSALRNRDITLQAVVDQEQGNNGEWIADNFMYRDTAKLPVLLGDGNVLPDQTDSGTIRKSSIMHNKFIVVDDRFTWTGSTNLSPSGIGTETHANVSILIDSPEVAQMFSDEFQQMFAKRHFSRAKKKTKKEDLVFSDGTKLNAYFSPQDDAIVNAILPFIENAQETLDIGMFFLTEQRVIEALTQAEQRGVRVRLMYDGAAAKHPYSYLEVLQRAGVEIKVEAWKGKMHLKTAVSDGNNIVIGSMNWSNSGDHTNDENTLVIENNETIANEFMVYFNQLWDSLPIYEHHVHPLSFINTRFDERELELLEVD